MRDIYMRLYPITEENIDTNTIEIPDKRPSDEYPYSSEDKTLLTEFAADYDEIMATMIGENYAALLADMTLPSKMQEKLKELSTSGIENYHADVEFWLLFDDYEIDCDEKKHIISQIFFESKVGVIYGSAGVGKSTLINHVSHYLNNEKKLYLTQTNPAKDNLIRKIDAENKTFSTIASFLNQQTNNTEYELLVIDECSTVSNRDMIAVLEKADFKMLLLVGDTYQIDSIWQPVFNPKIILTGKMPFLN